MSRNRQAGVALAGALVIAVTACGPASPSPSPVPGAFAIPTWVDDGHPVPAAARGGVLTYSNGCLTLTAPDSEPELVLWPTGWTARAADGVAIVTGPSGAALHSGQMYGFGGGGYDGLSSVDHVINGLSPTCETDHYWLVTETIPLPSALP